MGIKENFSQAVRELTGGTKEEIKRDKSIDGMKNAVAASDTSEFSAFPNASQESDAVFDEIEKRAAAAADEYSRQQTAFSDAGYSEPSIQQPEVAAPPPQQAYSRPQQSYAQTEDYRQSAPTDPFESEPRRPQGFERPAAPNVPQSSFSTSYRAAGDDNETTVISRNTVIDGNVRSFANMLIDGNIRGDVDTTKDIDVNGKIVGNVSCNNAKLRTTQIQGNVRMKGNAFIERDTLLIGDLSSTYANINGKIKGSLEIQGKAELKSDAVVFGDISASTITINDGAIVQGYVSTTFLNKEESKNIFPDAVTIGE